jgi:hypothetical protein
MSKSVASVVVSHFHSRRSISTVEANTVNAVVIAASGAVSEDDRNTLFSLSDRQTAQILAEFDAVECTAFVDYAFSHGWQHRDGIPDLFVKVMQMFSHSIARRMVAGKQMLSENIIKARNDWQAVACIVGQEVAYGSADCHIVQVSTMEPIAEMVRHSNRVSVSGITFEQKMYVSGYLVNGQYPCYANYETDRLYSNLALHSADWFAVAESEGNVGHYVLSCRKDKGDAVTYVDKNGKERYRRPNIGITPTSSFLRTLYGLVLSRFVDQEKGGITTSFDAMATETSDSRRAAGVRESDSDFDMVFDSGLFSENEQQLVRALELTVLNAEKYDEHTDDIPKLIKRMSRELPALWQSNYEGIVNETVHYKKFQRMVRSLQKSFRRVSNRLARSVASELPQSRLKETFVILPDVVDGTPIDYGYQLKPRPILKPFSQLWEETMSRPNYHPTGVQTAYPIPVTDFPCNVQMETSTDHVMDSPDVVMVVESKKGHHHPIHASGDYVVSVIDFANSRYGKRLSASDRTIIDLAMIGYGLPDQSKSPIAPKAKSKATLLWERIKGEMHRLSRVDIHCEYADAI